MNSPWKLKRILRICYNVEYLNYNIYVYDIKYLRYFFNIRDNKFYLLYSHKS